MPHTAFVETEINSTLKLIESLYRLAYVGEREDDVKLLGLYSKMSVVSLSGWVEDGMKGVADMVLEGLGATAQARLQKKQNEIHGASYEHFANRLLLAYGAHGLDFIESRVTDVDMQVLKSTLGTLKNARNDVSHSYKVKILRSPDIILTDFIKIYPILKRFEQAAQFYRDNHIKD